MTLPASGTITLDNFNTEVGAASGTARDLSWIYSNTKSGQQSYSMNGYYSKAWYQRNTDGNCNNGNCTNNCNCGDTNCTNCIITGTVNCANCDARSWIQNNCNCACTYNCTTSTVSYNCNAFCTTCFPAGTPILMYDGTYKAIELIEPWDVLMGADGLPAVLRALDSPLLGNRRMLAFAEDPSFHFSEEHLFWAKEGEHQWFWCPSPDVWRHEVAVGQVRGLHDNYSHLTGDSLNIASLDGFERRTVIDVTHETIGFNTQLYMPITLSGVPVIVGKYVATGGTNEASYPYSQFDWNKHRASVLAAIKETVDAV